MKLLAIRDDDACFFTDPARLARVHGPLLEKGFPLNLAAIPLVSANVKLRHKRLRGEYEPFISPEYRGREACFQIGDNKALVDFVSRTPGIHIAQHGCSHAYVNGMAEFDISDRAKIGEMADSGKEIIEKAFGVRPAFFVAPWDRISRAAYPVLAERFEGISTGWLTKDTVPFSWMPNYIIKKFRHRNYALVGGALMLEHRGCILSPSSVPQAVRELIMKNLKMHDIVTLLTHHWEYFNDDGSPNAALLNAYHEIVSELSERKDLRFASFDEIRRAVRSA